MNAPSRTRTLNVSRTLLLAAGIGLVGVGCSKSPSESGIEKAIEAQSGGKVDLDSNDDGGFSMKTEDGEMKIDKDGNFTITDADGNVVTGQSDDDSFSIDASDTADSSDDSGDTVDDITIGDDDNQMTVSQSKELPEQWPSAVPAPEGYIIQSSNVITEGDEIAISMAGSTEADAADFLDSYGAALESNGFERSGSYDTPALKMRTFSNGTWDVQISTIDDDDESLTTITLLNTDS